MTEQSQPITIDQLERFYHENCVPPEEAALIVGVGQRYFYALIKDAVEDGRIRRVTPGNKCVLYLRSQIEALAEQRSAEKAEKRSRARVSA